jgi:hypothetical protein
MSNKDKYFQRGISNDGNGGGRRAGARNRLQTTLLEALAADFEEHGAGVIRIARVEKPVEYLKVIVSVLPRELIVEQSNLAELTDEQIAGYIGVLQQMQITNAAASTVEQDEAGTKH